MKIMRRSFLIAAAASALPLVESTAKAQSIPRGRKLLVKGGYVVSCDKSIGEFKSGDVLIDGAKIESVGVDLPSGDADVIDAKNKLVLPGLIDTHRHTWETQLRSMIPEGDFFIYLKIILQTIAPRYRPDDVYIAIYSARLVRSIPVSPRCWIGPTSHLRLSMPTRRSTGSRIRA